MRVLPSKDGVPIKAWVDGVPLETQAELQLRETASLKQYIHKHIAVMPDVHFGLGATVGSVIPMRGAIVPAAVGVDIGCGMEVRRLPGVNASNLPSNLAPIRAAIEMAVPVGRAAHEEPGNFAWNHWKNLRTRFDPISKVIKKSKQSPLDQMGTLGGGNHFIELVLDENDDAWIMLHSGSRGVGNRIGQHYIGVARRECEKWGVKLPNRDLAYLPEETPAFEEYIKAVSWAQEYAMMNRKTMMGLVFGALRDLGGVFRGAFDLAIGEGSIVECHHNYIAREYHYGANCWVTRKGAVRAGAGDLGIIPGSMGAKSYIVRGLGNPESFESCSHGAGRVMSRRQAKEKFTVLDHEKATEGVECRKDSGVIDETPGAYKDIDAVMEAQKDLVEVVHTLRAVVCVKG